METASWRLREDLELHAAGVGMWTLRDPLRLSYYRLSAAELSFLRRAGSGATFEKLSAELTAEHPDFDWSPGELQRFLGAAIRAGLMCTLIPGQRSGMGRLRSGRGLPGSLLRGWWRLVSFRWRGIDPTALLKKLGPVTTFLLQPGVLTGGLLLVFFAFAVTVVQRDAFVSELPGLARLFAPGNLLLMTVAMAVIRGLHELGHAAVCSHLGGECRELGVQLTLLVPFPYCDVSDSWLWPERWKRMAVAGAGIGVEFILAACCALVWTCTYPGLLHAFCLNVMLLCSLNTLLVNGNPLLRYDGYYLLSDLCGIPNLAEAGNEEALHLFRRLLTGEPSAFLPDRRLSVRICLAVYGLCAAFWRLIITIALLTLVYRFAEPSGLGWAAVLPGMTALLLTGFQRLRMLRASLSTASGGAAAMFRRIAVPGLFAALLFVPFSRPLRAPFVLAPGTTRPVYVSSGGRVEWVIAPGARVKQGELLARLSNGDLELKIAELEGEIARRIAATAGIRQKQLSSGSGDAGLAAASELLDSSRRRLELLKTAQAELTIRSPRDGIVFPPRSQPHALSAERSRNEVFRSSEVLNSVRRNAWLEPQTELCSVGEYTDLRALACVEQSDVDRLLPDGHADLRFDSRPGHILTGVLDAVSGTVLQTVPPELIVTRRIPADAHGNPETGGVLYPATIRLSHADSPSAALYSTGTALLQTAPESLWSRLRRLAELTFSSPF